MSGRSRSVSNPNCDRKLRGHVGIGRTELGAARADANEVERPQLPDEIAAPLPAEQLRELTGGVTLHL
jgi:hypothetical protein